MIARPHARSAFGRAAMGDTADWDLFYASPSEVYVWRAPIEGAGVSGPEDAQLVLRAIARAQINKLDVRGVVFGYYEDGSQGLDVVFTADTILPYAIPQSAARLAEAALSDPALRARFPSLSFPGPRWLELTGPPDAIDFWRAHAIVWDDQVGPTDAFAQLEGIYRGEADDGPRLAPWKKEPPVLNGKPIPGEKSAWPTLALVGLGMAALVWIGAQVWTTKVTNRVAA